jgi:hypothetical protein
MRPAREKLAGGMRSRPRLQVTLAIVLLIALGMFVPGMLYFTELVRRELRFLWWLILLLGGLCWLLLRSHREKDEPPPESLRFLGWRASKVKPFGLCSRPR